MAKHGAGLGCVVNVSKTLPHRVDDHAERAQVHTAEEARQGLHARVGLFREGGVHHQQPSEQRSSLCPRPPQTRNKNKE